MAELSEDELDVLIQRFKESTRERMKRLRAATPRVALEARSARIREAIVGLDEFSAARTVLGYVAIRGEADVSALAAEVRAKGARYVLPRVEGETLGLYEIPTDEPLEPGAFGIPEPGPHLPSVSPHEVDFALVPALAVDERGHRIGWGGGFYDRVLPSLTRALRCAVVYDFQRISEVPAAPHDVSVDAVVSERNIIVIRRE